MTFFLNNCANRDHVRLFGLGAIFDFDLTGRQAAMAKDVRPGDECLVAARGSTKDEVVFTTFRYLREALMPDPCRPGTQVRVLFGRKLRSEILWKAVASRTQPYSVFFTVKGDFKRWSEVRPRERPANPPSARRR